MANIKELLNNIKNAVFGKDVRNSIHDAIQQCYEDASEQGNANMEVVQARNTYNTLNERLNADKNNLIARDSNLQSQINGLASGSPLVANSISDMTDTSKIYVNTADGHWYTYNNNIWVDMGVYQAMGIANDYIKLAHLNKDAFGNEYSIITSAGSSYPRITFMHTVLSNITKWKIKLKIKKNYISTNANFVIRLLRGVTSEGSQSSYVERSLGLNSSSLTNEYLEFEYEGTEETPLNSINGFAFRLNINNSTIESDWNVADIQFYLNDTLMTLNLVSTETFCPYVTDISEEAFFIANKNYVKNIIKQYDTQFNNKIEVLNNVINYDSLKKSNLYRIACWGDSITANGYPSSLQDLIGDNVEVVNRGVGGQCSGIISFRQGGNIVTAAEDFTIPASSEESVEFSYNISSGNYRNFSNIHTANVIINGIPGVISLNNVGTAAFTRSENGNATDITAGTQIFSSQAIHDNDLVIIMCGVNDVAFASSYISGVVQNIQAMINNLKPTIKRFLILSTTTTTGQTAGTSRHNAVTSINNQLKNLFPNNFVDLEDYLINQCIYDMGLTPTSEDLDKMENGTLPPQIMSDSTHPNSATKPYIAKFIYNELNLRGWIQK